MATLNSIRSLPGCLDNVRKVENEVRQKMKFQWNQQNIGNLTAMPNLRKPVWLSLMAEKICAVLPWNFVENENTHLP
ncbi:hypothetical protein Csa_016564 [Cucumis sativus]|uniref:Uncharacterized protein n=1 Tax=Cucumis sativus TaxID=3659 RepID=A0A0A0K8X5_CUCSA|nr:hypothetical protein Csa_016564 [Cucumis sativus]